MNKNLPILIISAIFSLIIAIVIGVSGSSDLFTVAACLAIPIAFAGIFFFKRNIWYLWILVPALSIAHPVVKNYTPILVFSITIPIYLCCSYIQKKKLTWNSIKTLDIFTFLLFLHVLYLFLIYPFGIGYDPLNSDYFAGKGYVTFAGGLLAFVSFGTLKSSSQEFAKILKWSLWPYLVGACIAAVLGILNREENLEETQRAAENVRDLSYIAVSCFFICIILIKYSLTDLLKKPLVGFCFLLSSAGLLLSGFRAHLVYIALIFGCTSLIYKRYSSLILAPIIACMGILTIAVCGLEQKLPHGIQRALSFIPFLDVKEEVRKDAEGSTDWRVIMWQYALDDRYNFIQDKVWGDGFARKIHHYHADIYSTTYRLNYYKKDTRQENIKWEGYMWLSGWHSGPIATINSLGYIGLGLYIIINVIGFIYAWQVCLIYKNHQYRMGILFYALNYIHTVLIFILTTGIPDAIPHHLYSLFIIKNLYIYAKREGLYIPKSTRKEYIPMICRQAYSEPAQ